MSQNGKPQSTPSGRNLPDAAIEQLVKTQYQKALNEAEELKLKSKELEVNARIAEKSIDDQSRIISSRPEETRKTLTRIAYIIGGFALLILIFLSLCLFLGKDDFAYSFLKGMGYVVTTGLGYWAGRQKGKKNGNDGGVPEAEIVN